MTSQTPSSSGTAPTVYLHIGTPKSGTTYLQSRFSVNHELAAEQGVLWPGPMWGRHVSAVEELRRLPDGEELPADGPWSTLAEEARDWQGRAVLISMEWMASLTPRQIEIALESLSPARVEVICTARDLVRSFVAQGQEMARNYRPWTWARLVDEVRNDKNGRPARIFWRQQNVPAILRRWLAAVPAERVHLVTVPPAGADPGVLWERFCSVVGVDGSAFAAPTTDNASLGVVSTVLMQRLNAVARAQGVTPPVYKEVLHTALAERVLAPRRTSEGPIGITDDLDQFLRGRSGAMVEELRSLGVDLVGDWADLVPTKRPEGRRPEDVTDRELLKLCMEGLVAMGVSQAEEIERLRCELEAANSALEASIPRRVKRKLVRLARPVLPSKESPDDAEAPAPGAQDGLPG